MNPPSLVELSIRSAIANLRYLADVGDVDINLLRRILPHATMEQLRCIEDSTEGRDLSEATDRLWKNFYGKEFGVESMNSVVEKILNSKVNFSWKQLYEAKEKLCEDEQNKAKEKYRKRCAEESALKQSRQVQFTTKLPPSSSKRSWSGGNGSCSNFSNMKSNLMKKAKMECLNSHEARVHAVMRRNATQRTSLPPPKATQRINYPPQKFIQRTSYPPQESTQRSSSAAQKPTQRTSSPAQKSTQSSSFPAQNATQRMRSPAQNATQRTSSPAQNATQRKSFPGQSVLTKPNSLLSKGRALSSASSSCGVKSLVRR